MTKNAVFAPMLLIGLLAAGSLSAEEFAELAELAPGWRGEIVAKVDQSYCGWGVAIGDADNDGQNELVLATGRGIRTQPGSSHVVVVKKR